MYLTGIPVQSALPVRRTYFDDYPGEIVILETVERPPRPPRAWVVELISQHQADLTPAERERLIEHHYTSLVRRSVEPRVKSLTPAPSLSAGSETVLNALEQKLSETRFGERPFPSGNPAMLGGRPPLIAADLLPNLFYRFVQPEERTGERLNYAARARTGAAQILRSGWVAIRCPPLSGETLEGTR
jgi:hypothetical protein